MIHLSKSKTSILRATKPRRAQHPLLLWKQKYCREKHGIVKRLTFLQNAALVFTGALPFAGVWAAVPALAEPAVPPSASEAPLTSPGLVTSPRLSASSSSLAESDGQLSELFATVRDSFWQAENELATRAFAEDSNLQHNERLAFYAKPIEKTDPLFAQYAKAAKAADAYVALATQSQSGQSGLPAMLYLGALAHYSIGSNARALDLFEQLRTKYPNYKRDQYINDRSDPNPRYSVPVSASIAKLIFYLRLQNLPKDPPDAFAALKQVTNDALTALSTQHEYSLWVASLSDKYNYRSFDESNFGSEPDQRRASALPPSLRLVKESWDKLLEKALARGGAKPLRDWLRSLSASPDAPLAQLASYRLQNIDALIIKALFAEAQYQMDAKNFDGARAKYRQIMAEYAGTDAARRAEEALPRITPTAVAYYREEADVLYKPKEQMWTMQTKAREFYEKMYKEDPDGPSADYALYYWSEALGTEGKLDQEVKQLQQWLSKYKNSPLRVRALYLLGFSLGRQGGDKMNSALKYFKEVSEAYPNSEEAPEALWYSAFFLSGNHRLSECDAFVRELVKKYPQHVRSKYAEEWLQVLQADN
jgi:TolA-binding protein